MSSIHDRIDGSMPKATLPSAVNSIGCEAPSNYGFDPRSLEIKTKSVEQTLVPLVMQITTLVNLKENFLNGNKRRSDKAVRSALKIGSGVEAAIERFVAVGETIADENIDIQPEMYEACHDARLAGLAYI